MAIRTRKIWGRIGMRLLTIPVVLLACLSVPLPGFVLPLCSESIEETGSENPETDDDEIVACSLWRRRCDERRPWDALPCYTANTFRREAGLAVQRRGEAAGRRLALGAAAPLRI